VTVAHVTQVHDLVVDGEEPFLELDAIVVRA